MMASKNVPLKQPQPLSKGIALFPAPSVGAMQQIDPQLISHMTTNTDKYQQLSKSSTNKGTIINKLNITNDGDVQTETTKANERSKPNLEESIHHGIEDGIMDDEDFEKLMGNIEKTQLPAAPAKKGKVMNNTSGIDDEDFF